MPHLDQPQSKCPPILWNTHLPLVYGVCRYLPLCNAVSDNQLALRDAVAKLYNHTYRQGKQSKYTYENVCIVPGGRAGLSRVAAVISDVYCVSSISDFS